MALGLNKYTMSYEINFQVRGEKGADVDDFIAEINELYVELNKSWAKVKAQLPVEQQDAAEQKVRAVLKA